MKQKVKCPICGHKQKIHYSPDAVSRGVYVRCQGRQCRKIFEIRLGNNRDR